MLRTIKIPAFILLCTFMIFSMTACSSEKSAIGAFDRVIETMKSGDAKQISAYYDISEAAADFLPNASGNDGLLSAVCGILSRLSYDSPVVQKQKDSSYLVTAKITSADFSYIIDSYIENVSVMTSSDEYKSRLSAMSSNDYQTMLAEQMTEVLNNPDLPMTQKELSLTMICEKGEWKLSGNNDIFFNSLIGNLLTIVGSLG